MTSHLGTLSRVLFRAYVRYKPLLEAHRFRWSFSLLLPNRGPFSLPTQSACRPLQARDEHYNDAGEAPVWWQTSAFLFVYFYLFIVCF